MNKEKMLTKKRILIVLAAFLLLDIIGIVIWYCTLTPLKAPDPVMRPPQTAVKYLASKQFAQLPSDEKRKYMEKLRSSEGTDRRSMFNQLTDKERQAVHKNIRKEMQREMKQRMKKFFAMSQSEQNQFLDKMIEEMKQRREADQKAGRRGPGGSGGPGGPDSGRMQAMFENTDSSTRAEMHEFHNRMEERMRKK